MPPFPTTTGEESSLRKAFPVGRGPGISTSQQLLSPNPGFQVLETLIEIYKSTGHRNHAENTPEKQRSQGVKDSEPRCRLLGWHPASTTYWLSVLGQGVLCTRFLTSKMEMILTGCCEEHTNRRMKVLTAVLQAPSCILSPGLTCWDLLSFSLHGAVPLLLLSLSSVACFPDKTDSEGLEHTEAAVF